jgi:hypothetical protein
MVRSSLERHVHAVHMKRKEKCEICGVRYVCHLSTADLYVMSTMSFRSVSQAKLALRIYVLGQPNSLDLSAGSSKLSVSVCWVNKALSIYLLSHPSYLHLSVWSTKLSGSLWIYLLRNLSSLCLCLLGHLGSCLYLFAGSSKLSEFIFRVSQALWIYTCGSSKSFGSVCKVVKFSGSVFPVNQAFWICLSGQLSSLNLSGGSSMLSGSLWSVI